MNPIISTVSKPFRLISNGSLPRRLGEGVSLPPWSWRVAAVVMVVSFAGYLGLETLRLRVGGLWQRVVIFPALADSIPALCCWLYLARRAKMSAGQVFGLTGIRLGPVLVSAAGLAVLELFLTAATGIALGGWGNAGSERHQAVSLFTALDMVLWAPLCEELLFRGLLYSSLRTRLGIASATVLTAAAFALMHPYPLSAQGALFVSALLSSLWYERTRCLWPCIISHFLNNLLP